MTSLSELPLRLRWRIVALLSASIAINLMDRQVLSVVAPLIREQFTLSNTEYSYIVFAFQLGMFLGQVPAGLLMDSFGARAGLVLILLAWSAANGLHALAGGLAAFVGLRFLMGLSECGNYTGGIKTIAGLFSAERRALAGGIFNAGAQIGSVVAPPLIVLVTVHFGWRMAFVMPSLLGLLWIMPWLASYPPQARAGAAAHSAPGDGLRVLLTNRQVVGLLLLRVFSGPLVSFYWYWLPEYLRHGRGMSFVMIGALAWLPYVFGSLGNLAGGFFSDYLIRHGHTMDRARKLGFSIGSLLSALSMLLPLIRNDYAAVATICLIVFGNNWVAATYIGTVGDIFPERVVGRVNGIAGAGDSGMGMVTMLATGIVVDRFSYLPVFAAAGILPLLALASIFLVVRRIEPVKLEGA
ncbi:MAG: MFS transporter [Acidobacteria bacterium]|nr:MFS transporter [Acidobacteriota bacterium]